MIGRMYQARIECIQNARDKDIERKTFIIRPFMVTEAHQNMTILGGYVIFGPYDKAPSGEPFGRSDVDENSMVKMDEHGTVKMPEGMIVQWRRLKPSIKANPADPDSEWSEGFVGPA